MRLIVGYQATPSGEDGIALAAVLARTLQAELDICIVLPCDRPVPSKAPVEVAYENILVDQATEWLSDAMKLVPTDISAEGHLLFDESFAQGLIDIATEREAYMIVVGAASDGLLGRHAIGSVTSELLHVAHVPLALAPRGTRHNSAGRIREITCAVGNRPGAEALTDAAYYLSTTASVPLRLLSLVSIDSRTAGEDTTTKAARERDLAKATENLQRAQSALPEGAEVVSILAEGSGIEKAVTSLDWHDGDLLMVGSSRLGQPRRLFLGSTAAKILRVLPVPMIVVPRGGGDRS
ncbi:universal stress protein [Rhodococcus sp. G-MC3]|uniref:universal stress protein n=1 Tax=Rhodococcus sp. G-MC3 TaxID=3046209 RepID=UPI0024B9D840|nr:universal stress protein [Rhodococcus sp. G-MC3]MDJ0395977.1 universal stress protein [Rhodococcus sp. G-MC3]